MLCWALNSRSTAVTLPNTLDANILVENKLCSLLAQLRDLMILLCFCNPFPLYPRGLANQKECTQALSLFSQQTVKVFYTICSLYPFHSIHCYIPIVHLSSSALHHFPTNHPFQTHGTAFSPK